MQNINLTLAILEYLRISLEYINIIDTTLFIEY